MTSNHQTTNFVFPIFFREFFSVWPDEKENKLFIGTKLRKNLCWTSKKFVISFNCSCWENFVKKNWRKQDSWFGGLMSGTRYPPDNRLISNMFVTCIHEFRIYESTIFFTKIFLFSFKTSVGFIPFFIFRQNGDFLYRK